MKAIYQDLEQGVTCIDAQYFKPDSACFYLVQQGDECMLIDTGTSHCAEYLAEVLADKGLSPQQVKYIVPTHVHLDHAG